MRCVQVIAMLAMLAIGGVAHAQAPGQQAPAAPPPAPADPGIPVMADRWAASVMLGGEGLTPRTDGAARVAFTVVELGVRFRIAPAWELAASFAGGGSNAGQDTTVDLFVDGRYRFLADRPWNGYVLAGLGVVSAAASNASSPDTKGRGAIRIGGGVERRWRHFALQLELRLTAVAEDPQVLMLAQTITPSYELARYGLTGGSLSFGASWYF